MERRRTTTPQTPFLFLSLLSLVLLLLITTATSSSLSTESRWIVDVSGRRVKLTCVSWVAHLEPVVAEGLSKQPLDALARRVESLGFNCVRLTWPVELAVNDTLANTTVRQSFQRLGLREAIAGFQTHNPDIIDLTLIEAFKAVVTSLGNNNVMVILDNHISKPGWCCSSFDGNGFFGDKFFNPATWVNGLTRMATLFKGVSNVVGMSLRNELRGPKQNTNDWYKYMQKGAEAVNSANPDLLVILSGLNFDTDLSFLSNHGPVNLTFTGKLVFEVHWYSFSDGNAWETGNHNQVCGAVTGNVKRRAGFLLEKGFPLMVTEFGVDQSGASVNDNRYIDCFMALAAELDLDWSLWTLVGSYYLREGVVGMNEFYGLVNFDWVGLRNSSLVQKLSALQYPLQGPGISETKPHKIIFHPSTGLCVLRESLYDPLMLGPCPRSDGWYNSPQKTLTIKGTYFCLKADNVGKPAQLGIMCSESDSKWDLLSDSKLHLAATVHDDGLAVCLDVDSSRTVVTNPCKCLSRDRSCDPSSQWFKLVDSVRRPRLDSSTAETGSVLENLMTDFERKSIVADKDDMIGSPIAVSRTRTHKIIFHPPTNQCVLRHNANDPIKLGPCSMSDRWYYSSAQKTLTIKGTYFCLQADSVNTRAWVGIKCTEANSKWDVIASGPKSCLAGTTKDGLSICLDVGPDNVVMTSLCKQSSDGASEWFELVEAVGIRDGDSETESLADCDKEYISDK